MDGIREEGQRVQKGLSLRSREGFVEPELVTVAELLSETEIVGEGRKGVGGDNWRRGFFSSYN